LSYLFFALIILTNGAIIKPYWNLEEDIMAVNITLKNIPPDLHADLKSSAARHRRSLNSEILALLEERLWPRRRTPEEVLAAAEAVRAKMTGVWLSLEQIDEMKREGRR
jgi:antitoxin FitA